MRPEDRYSTSRFQAQRSDDRPAARSATPQSQSQRQNSAAANYVRGQINNIYDSSASDLSAESPYQRTHAQSPQPQADQWRQYHSAWQNYYQKYYERYYLTKVQEAQAQLRSQAASNTGEQPNQAQPAQAESAKEHEPELAPTESKSIRSDALSELRQNLRRKVRASAQKARSSRHFIPLAAAAVVVLLFVFLQYNRVFISNVKAYVSPGSIDPQNIIVDPGSSVAVDPEPKLIIPKINVDVPVVYGIGPDNDSQMKAMEKGVAHFAIPGANSVPGQIGNTVLSGHSSNDLFDPGDYKFIFAQLDKLATGDMIYANYEGTRYSYTVTKKEVVMPDEVDKLIYDTDKPVMTLITCTPLGTAEKRLLVTAEQVSPDPTAASPASSSDDATSTPIMPSNSPTLLQRLFSN